MPLSFVEKPSPLFKYAGWLVILSGILHVISFLVGGGLNPQTQQFIIIGLIWMAIGFGVLRGKRWVAWIAYLVMLFGSLAALMVSSDPIPKWWMNIILVVDVLAALCLFGILWGKKK